MKTHEYVITSQRGFWDETDNTFYTDKEYKIGDLIVLDGIVWEVVAVIE